jgi:hypothetical protein
MEKRIIYQPSDNSSALRQGEILTDVVQYISVIDEMQRELQQLSELSFTPIKHPYSIIVTQDCDLDWDYKARKDGNNNPAKLLNSIILCEIDTADAIRKTDGMNRKEWDLVESHRHERFYFFENIPPEFELEQKGMPELSADFKKVFGLDAASLYRQIEIGEAKRRSILASPYLEHFSKRYHSFHGRVALPFQYESERES